MAKDRYHDWYKLYDKLSVEINPDPEELKQLFNQESPIDPINLRGLELKFEAATRGQIVIEPKHPNVLRGFFQPNNVINITSETEEAYSFIDHSHVYQIPKTIAEQK